MEQAELNQHRCVLITQRTVEITREEQQRRTRPCWGQGEQAKPRLKQGVGAGVRYYYIFLEENWEKLGRANNLKR